MTTTPLVCIVDDAVDYRLLLQQLFKRHLSAYRTCFFASGKDFLDSIPHLDSLPSLILLDRHMPPLDGYQTLLWLKAHPIHKRIPVVMMSADASEGEMSECYQAHVNSFLRKPLGFEAMQQQMMTICQYWLETNQ